MENVKLVGTHKAPGTHGFLLYIRGDPGGGRKNSVSGCEIFVPRARKSPEQVYDYEATIYHTLSQDNLFRTDLPAAGGQHFCVEYGPGTVIRRDRFRGTAPGPGDSFRPGHGSDFDTRQALTAR
jgi:hypothetical protein